MLTIEDTFSLVNRQAVEKNYRYEKSIVLKMPATGQVWQIDLWYPQ